MNSAKQKELIRKSGLDDLIGEKFGNYSKYIIQERAIPDLRDGLKPVQRRILYAMHALRLNYKSSYKKSARVVGDVIGKYHPHGDTSVYEAMVRLGQEWKVNMPLIDMHGNKGSIDGDSAAAMRYTEARLSKISSELLSNIEKNLVLFSPNFDDSELEPTVLPAKYPNLLVNGSTGIAAGYATNIPPHNLNELIEAIIYILKNESVTLSNLTKYIKGPDFPTGSIVSSTKSIKDAYKSGKGKVVITSKWSYNPKAKSIEITEIPFEVNKSDLVKKIDDLIRLNKIPGLKEIRDDTDRTGMLISLILKQESNNELIMNYLFKTTDLRKNYNFNMVSIKDKKPQLLSLVDILTSFTDFQIKIYKKLFNFELNKLQKRLEIVEGLIKVIDVIDEIIKVIRSSKNKKEAQENISLKFGFTKNQSEAIVTLRLYRLTSTDINELLSEQKTLKTLILHYKKGINEEKYLKEQIIEELERISKEYGVPRKSIIEEEIEEIKINEKDLIQEEEVWISVTYQGYIKKMSQKTKDILEIDSFGKREDDIIISLSKSSNLKNLVLFSSNGRYFNIPIYKLCNSKWNDIGEHISKFMSINALDKIIAIAIIDNFEKNGELIFATKKGMIKRSLISEMSLSSTKKGSKFINLKDSDEVVSIAVLKENDSFITTITKSGFAVKYIAQNLTTTGLNASGVKNVNLTDNDNVKSIIINSIENVDNGISQLIFVAHNGKGKRIRLKDIKPLSRGSKGSMIATKTKSNPFEVINTFNLEVTDNIYILTILNENKKLKPKGELLITDTKSGLTKLTKNGIKLAFNDLTLKFDDFKKNTKQKTKNNDNKMTQLNLENILDEF